MSANQSLWIYFADAGLVVKSVMLLLLAASILSWTFIIQRAWVLRKAQQSLQQFEDQFWSGNDLTELYETMDGKQLTGIAGIYHAGFKEFIHLQQQAGKVTSVLMGRVQRAMRIVYSRETDKLEQHLPFLASVGSISPYVGLFGTVWGIMTSFHALGSVQQATIAMVAPGISEALIATAMGLFAAIPAVLAYNRYTNNVERLLNQYETFQEEFVAILENKTDGE